MSRGRMGPTEMGLRSVSTLVPGDERSFGIGVTMANFSVGGMLRASRHRFIMFVSCVMVLWGWMGGGEGGVGCRYGGYDDG